MRLHRGSGSTSRHQLPGSAFWGAWCYAAYRRLTVCAILIALLVSACQSGPTVSTVPPAAAVHVFLWGRPATTSRDLNLAKSAGFTWIKQLFEWRDIERDGKGAYEWSEPDRIVNAAQGSGLKIVARLD